MEAASAANAPANVRILPYPNALLMRVFAAFISSIVCARLAILSARSAFTEAGALETDIAA